MKLLFYTKIIGPVPSKKNAYTRSRNGGIYIKKSVRAGIDSITKQMKSDRWRYGIKTPITNKRLHVSSTFHGKSRCDVDNRHQTLLDCLQRAGVIKNDRDVRSGAYEEQEYVKLVGAAVGVYEL